MNNGSERMPEYPTHTSGQQHCPGPHDHSVQCWNAGWEARGAEHPAEDGGVTAIERAAEVLMDGQHFHGCPTPHGRPFDCDYCQERAASMGQERGL